MEMIWYCRRERRVTRFLSAVLATLGLGALQGCQKEPDVYVPADLEAVMTVSAADIRSAITARLDSASRPEWVSADHWRRVAGLYDRFDRAPLWLESDGVKGRARALLRALDEAPTHALSTEEYPVAVIRHTVNDIALTSSRRRTSWRRRTCFSQRRTSPMHPTCSLARLILALSRKCGTSAGDPLSWTARSPRRFRAQT